MLPSEIAAEQLSTTPAQRSSAGERIHALDSLRAVAMFLGIVLHAGVPFTVTSGAIPWPARDLSNHLAFDFTLMLIHGFRMQLFFFLSGFFACLMCRRVGPADYLKQRWKRLGIPFAVGMVVLMPIILLLFVWGFSRMPEAAAVVESGSGMSDIPTAHLWFLEYLLIFSTVAAGLAWLSHQSKTAPAFLARLSSRIPASALQALLFIPATVLLLWNGPRIGEVHEPGKSIVPSLEALAYFGLFFAAGWWWYGHREALRKLSRHLVLTFVLALTAFSVHLAIFVAEPDAAAPDYVLQKTTGLACSALYAWLMTFAVTGCFLHFASAEHRWMRYLADASYWCYLVHLPIVLWLQIMLAPVEWTAGPKFTLILIATTALSLLVYHYRVRYTCVGTLLNGKRERPNHSAN